MEHSLGTKLSNIASKTTWEEPVGTFSLCPTFILNQSQIQNFKTMVEAVVGKQTTRFVAF